jgi:hypothetical protein
MITHCRAMRDWKDNGSVFQFTDSACRTWNIRLDIAGVRRVKAGAGIDLLRPFEGNPPPIAIVANFPDLVAEIVWQLISPMAGGVSQDDFFASLDADKSAALMRAVEKEYADFFAVMGRTEVRAAIAMVRDKTIAMETAAVQSIAQRAATTGESVSNAPGSAE